MKPGEIKFATRALGAPDNWDSEKQGRCEVLPIRDRLVDGAHIMESAWYPSADELDALNRGNPVVLTIWGAMHPPVAVGVEADSDTIPKEDRDGQENKEG